MKNVQIDVALTTLGIGISTIFVSTDGNGQNPLPVAAGMLLVAFVACAVSFALVWIIRSILLLIAATIVITDLLFVLYFVSRVAYSQHVDRHIAEEAFLLPIVFVIVTAPTVVLSSVSFCRIASRTYSRLVSEKADAANEPI